MAWLDELLMRNANLTPKPLPEIKISRPPNANAGGALSPIQRGGTDGEGRGVARKVIQAAMKPAATAQGIVANTPVVNDVAAYGTLELLLGSTGVANARNILSKTQDAIVFAKYLLKSPTNAVRIALDAALQKSMIAKIKAQQLTGEILPPNQNFEPEYQLGQYSGWKTTDENGTIIKYTGMLDSILKKYGFKSGSMKFNELKEGPDGNPIMMTTRKNLVGFEMADNFYWGISIKKATQYESKLPDFPADFSNGWWPVMTASFTKSSLKSRSIRLPFINLEIPFNGERPSGLKLSILDNARRDVRYYFEKYVKSVFDISNNTVLPYKNLLFDIQVYQYDCTLNTMYTKNLLCVVGEMTNSFIGEQGHSADEIEVNFTIVGEVPVL